MDRRNTLKWLGAVTLGASLPALAFRAYDNLPTLRSGSEVANATPSAIPKVTCRIIGVGDAGIRMAVAAYPSGLLHATESNPEFACVSMGRSGIGAAIQANRQHPDIAPIRPVQLGRYGAGGNVNIARAAARKYDRALRSLVDGADVVILVAGIGGGTGSAVAPILANMAMEAGALVLGVIVTPFKWEIGRYPNAFAAVKALESNSHYLASLPNEADGEIFGDDATLDDVFTQQAVLGAACIERLMKDAARYCIQGRSRSA